MNEGWSPSEPVTEPGFALAEAGSQAAAESMRDRLLTAALTERAPGTPVDPADHISGWEAFRRLSSRLGELLGRLSEQDWRQRTVRGLDVQGLVGHLVGVESDFAQTLLGSSAAAEADHVRSTQAAADRQRGRAPARTREEWAAAVGATLEIAAASDADRVLRLYGVELPLDAWLVARAFESWIHEEDIRAATKRPRSDPDPEALSRMTELATVLLPAGIAGVAGRPRDAHARLVLTGPGGGTWDVALAGGPVVRAAPGREYDAHVVVDAAEFCRVVGNRADLRQSGAIVREDGDVAAAVFAGAAALAFD